MTLTNTETTATEAEVTDYLDATRREDRAAAQAVMDKAIRTRIARVTRKLQGDRPESTAELAALHQQVARLTIENAALTERYKQAIKHSRKWETRAKDNSKEVADLRSKIDRRDQTIQALRTQLDERNK